MAEVISLVPQVGEDNIFTCLTSPSWGPSPPWLPAEGMLLRSEDRCLDPGSCPGPEPSCLIPWPGVRSWLSQQGRGSACPALRPRCLVGLGLRVRGRELCRNETGTLGDCGVGLQNPATANLGSLLLFSGDRLCLPPLCYLPIVLKSLPVPLLPLLTFHRVVRSPGETTPPTLLYLLASHHTHPMAPLRAQSLPHPCLFISHLPPPCPNLVGLEGQGCLRVLTSVLDEVSSPSESTCFSPGLLPTLPPPAVPQEGVPLGPSA